MFTEVEYACKNPACGHTQTIRYFSDLVNGKPDVILPVTCCVKCRAGFGKELAEQYQAKLGMFPGKQTAVA